MGDAQAVFDWIAQQPLFLGLMFIMLAAMIEYVFPPFPGDTVVVAAAMLIPNAGWPWWAVFLAIMGGSVAGAMAAFVFGRWLNHVPEDHWVSRRMRHEKVAPRVEKVRAGFRRHGARYILANRFLPAFRSVFFIAAGLAELHPLRVAGFAALSALAWNALLMALGWSVGYRLSEITPWLQRYGLAVLVGLAATLVFWWVRRRFQKK